MTSRAEDVAGSWRKARGRRHRELSEAGGAVRFAGDALFWSFVAGGCLAILLMSLAAPQLKAPTGFTVCLGEPEPGGEVVAVVVLVSLVLGFGVLTAWCEKHVRDVARERRSKRALVPARQRRARHADQAPSGEGG